MYGNTLDISMFRFVFWQPVLFFEAIARYPSPNFLPGRFISIAWSHDDAFTYFVKLEPDGDWSKGQELIRNIVKPRSLTEQIARNPTTDMLDPIFSRKKAEHVLPKRWKMQCFKGRILSNQKSFMKIK
jgi:hypothetical protein